MATNPFDQQTDDLTKKYASVAPTLGAFDESKSTAGRVADITSSGSPLMSLARTRATQTANARGLRNSSIAAGAGEKAVIETATPMAAQDAQLYQSQNLANQTAKNNADQFNAQQGATIGLRGVELGENSRQFGVNTDLQKQELTQQNEQFGRTLMEQARQSDAGMANQRTIAQMDADSRKELIGIEAAYKQDIAASDNISGAWATMMQGIQQIQNNPDIDEAAKKALIQNNIAGFQSFSNFWKKIEGGTVDVSDLLNFGVEGGTGAVPGTGGVGTGAGTGAGTGSTAVKPGRYTAPYFDADSEYGRPG